jgi:hypothetical protein
VNFELLAAVVAGILYLAAWAIGVTALGIVVAYLMPPPRND